MAHWRLPVRKIKEIIRLKHACGLSEREIAQSCDIARSTVGDYLHRAEVAGVTWPDATKLTERQLEARLFPRHNTSGTAQRQMPDGAYIYSEWYTIAATLL